jgi:putative membrane protein
MKTNKLVLLFSILIVLLFIGSITYGDGDHSKSIDESIAEIREDLGLEPNNDIDPEHVGDEHLEQLGEAVMAFLHPNDREHELVDEMMGGMPMMGWGMHGRRGGGMFGTMPGTMMGGYRGFHVWRIVMWIVLLGVIGVVIWLVVRSQRRHGTFQGSGVGSALEIAKRRYAQGEISKQEFETMKSDLQ